MCLSSGRAILLDFEKSISGPRTSVVKFVKAHYPSLFPSWLEEGQVRMWERLGKPMGKGGVSCGFGSTSLATFSIHSYNPASHLRFRGTGPPRRVSLRYTRGQGRPHCSAISCLIAAFLCFSPLCFKSSSSSFCFVASGLFALKPNVCCLS